MSENCDNYEILVSTWLDEGLERDGQRQLLDHLARCAECRRFYREARALEGTIAMAMAEPKTPTEPAPEEVWDRIESEARSATASRRSKWMPWALAAAAALLIGFVLPLVPWPAAGTQSAEAPIEILLESDRAAMTETRFMELTTELLQADRRYHYVMQDVMEAVIEGSWEGEGATSEGDVEERRGEDDEERRSRIRT